MPGTLQTLGCATCCPHAVKADPCDGGPDLYVAVAALPGSPTVFKYATYCYTINPGGTHVVPPHRATVLTGLPTTSASCSACAASPTPTPPPGGVTGPTGGSSGGGGGSGGSAGGGGSPTGDTWGPGTPPPKGFLATPCSGQTALTYNNLYVLKGSPKDPAGTFIFRYGGACYTVTIGSGDGDTPPDGAPTCIISGSYPDCVTCIGGYPCSLCADQGDTSKAPSLWVRGATGPSTRLLFRYEGFCYTIGPVAIGGSSPIPVAAVLVTPPTPSQFATCTDCTKGVSAVLCPDVSQPDGRQVNSAKAPKLWVPANLLPDATVYFENSGWCYSIDPDGDQVSRPTGARVIQAVKDYADCMSCVCGQREVERKLGVKAVLCSFQYTAGAQDVWVTTDHLPASEIVFVHAGVCYVLDPTDTPRKIPGDATVLAPSGTFLNCWDCTSNGGPGDGGGPSTSPPPDPNTGGPPSLPPGSPPPSGSGGSTPTPTPPPWNPPPIVPPNWPPPPPPPPPPPDNPPLTPTPTPTGSRFYLVDCATSTISDKTVPYQWVVDNHKADWTFDIGGKCLSVSTFRTDAVNDIDTTGATNQFSSCDICLLQKMKHCDKDSDKITDVYVSAYDTALAVTNAKRSFFWGVSCYEVDPTAPKLAPTAVIASHGGTTTTWTNLAGSASTLADCCDCLNYANKYEYEEATWDPSNPVTSLTVDVSSLEICDPSGNVVTWDGERPQTVILFQDGDSGWYGEYTAGGITFAVSMFYSPMGLDGKGTFVMEVNTDYGPAYFAVKGGGSPVGTYDVACRLRSYCLTNYNNVKTLAAA